MERRDLLAEVIEMVRLRPCLWRQDLPAHKNKNLKSKAYSEILDYLKFNGINITVQSLKDKLVNMRRRVREERKKVTDSLKSGAGTDDVYEPKLWYYKNFSFVYEFDDDNRSRAVSNLNPSSPTASSVNMDETESIYNQSEFSEDGVENVFKAPDPVGPPPAKKKKTIKEQQQEFLSCCTSTLQKSSDEFEAVGSSVAAKLRRMDPAQELLAEQLILKVLVDGLSGNLTQHHDIVQMVVED